MDICTKQRELVIATTTPVETVIITMATRTLDLGSSTQVEGRVPLREGDLGGLGGTNTAVGMGGRHTQEGAVWRRTV